MKHTLLVSVLLAVAFSPINGCFKKKDPGATNAPLPSSAEPVKKPVSTPTDATQSLPSTSKTTNEPSQPLKQAVVPLLDAASYASYAPAKPTVALDAGVKDFTIRPVASKPVASDWNTFDILVWQYLTDVEKDHTLWEAVGFRGFHVDRDGNASDREWAKTKVCYQDHAADKGYLHLKDKEKNNVDSGYGTKVNLPNKGGWVHPRPRPLLIPAIRDEMKSILKKNASALAGTKCNLVAFDDEISIGTFNSPVEVCGDATSVREFNEFLRWKYNDDIGALNKQWGFDQPTILIIIGGKVKFPNDSAQAFLRDTAADQYAAFSQQYGNDISPKVIRLNGAKMYEELPGRAFFMPFKAFDGIPAISFEWVRQTKETPFKNWNLSMWADFRDYIDYQFTGTLRELTEVANEANPTAPAGYVGGHAPSPWNGLNYSLVRKAIQWIEAYDIGGSNEVLRGLNPNLIRTQTYFPPKDYRRCEWFIGYYLAHKTKALICWPADGENSLFKEDGKEGVDGIAQQLTKSAPYVKQIIDRPSKEVLAATLTTSPIAVYFSQPSVRVCWAIDSECHGTTWPARSSSLDNQCASYHQTLTAWFKLLEDVGHQYIVIDSEQLFAGRLSTEGIKVLILPKTVSLSENEVKAITAFAENGGVVIADFWTGLFDGNGKGLADDQMPVNALFGIGRNSAEGWFDRTELCEIDGEKDTSAGFAILAHLYAKAKHHNGMPVAENGLKASKGADTEIVDNTPVLVSRTLGKGRTMFLNVSVLPYIDMSLRMSDIGEQYRSVIRSLLVDAGIVAACETLVDDKPSPITETLIYQKADGGKVIAIVKNPTRHGTISTLGEIPGIPSTAVKLTVKFKTPIKNVLNLATGESVQVQPDAKTFVFDWSPWQAAFFSFE